LNTVYERIRRREAKLTDPAEVKKAKTQLKKLHHKNLTGGTMEELFAAEKEA
jgi:hypothetical protein